MILFTLVVVLLSCVSGISSKQRIDIGHPVICVRNASASVAISQVQVTLQSREPSSNANKKIKTSVGAKSNKTVAQSTIEYAEEKVSVEAEAVPALFPVTVQSSQTATTPPSINDTTFAPSSRTHSAMVRTETANRKTKLTGNPITPSLGAKSTESPALIFGSQTIKANDRNEHTVVDVQTPTLASTTTTGSDSSATFIVLQTLSVHSLLVFESSSSQLSLNAATSAVSKIPPLLKLNRQNITANSHGHYKINGQTLTLGAVATVSGNLLSIAPKASDNGAVHSTNVPSKNTTTGSTSGPARRSVEVFNGGALGERHGLWSSSIVLLVGIVVLLWL